MFQQMVPAMKSRVCLVNSFYGLDMPCALPANVILTGSTAPRSLCKGNSEVQEKMNAWLRQVRADGLRVVYVTMGSWAVAATPARAMRNSLGPPWLQALFYGLKSLTPKVAVAWSLKEEQHQQLPGGLAALPPHFFVQKWLPQGPRWMGSGEGPNLSLGMSQMTHCGFGGLNETIAAGKPMVALPFRADQPANAQLAKRRGMAEVLQPQKLGGEAMDAAVGWTKGGHIAIVGPWMMDI
eukprot:Skav216147  [mRNA]  locus=scaffold2590:89046:94636:- [translate_table: standard]